MVNFFYGNKVIQKKFFHLRDNSLQFSSFLKDKSELL